jgi:hypothetical protein
MPPEIPFDPDAFDALGSALHNDQEAVRREIEAELVASKGPEWFEANRRNLDNWWAQAMWQMGYEDHSTPRYNPPQG